MDGARTHIPPSARGFTLIEISIVVAIVLTLLTLGLGFVTAQLSSAAYSITKQRQAAIKDALIAFLGTHKRLPCPYVPPGPPDPVTGLENTPLPSTCPEFGVVPFATLGLSRELAEDGWGNLFSYRVYADPAPICPTDWTRWNWGNYECFGEGKDGIAPLKDALKIRDGTSPPSPTNVVAVVISHGANGLGAWAAQGTRNVASTACEEAHNIRPELSAWPLPLPSPPCTLEPGVYYRGERQENDDVVAYLIASETLQTLARQGVIKPAVAKVNEDLQWLFEKTIDDALKLATPTCVITDLSVKRDPWGVQYKKSASSILPMCIYSEGGNPTPPSLPNDDCSNNCQPPRVCRLITKETLNRYYPEGKLPCPPAT